MKDGLAKRLYEAARGEAPCLGPWDELEPEEREVWLAEARAAREFFHITEEQLELGVNVEGAVAKLEEAGLRCCERKLHEAAGLIAMALRLLGAEVETPA